ncbi:XF1762 family protein (plasmid) [Microtetraspora malaysiensis]|uniref:XF1762 family protein n=1 Tax=Microtetraspora malaysiensis TaxID=161358 RepID=UPI003D8B5C97
MTLRIVPVHFNEAKAFVTMWHRHLRPPVGGKFCIGVADDLDVLRGVAIVGLPVARRFNDKRTLEVTRVATDGTPNAPSKLYARAWEIAAAMGYDRLITYTHTLVYGPACAQPCEHWSCRAIRVSESGASLRGAGWVVVARRPPRPGWNRPSRPRTETGAEGIPRTLWEAQ